MESHAEADAIEVRLFLEAIHARYGYDLRGYAAASMSRRVMSALARSGLSHLGDLQHRVLRDPGLFANVLDRLTVRVSDMFLTALSEEVGERLEVQPRDYLDRSRRAADRMVSLLDALLEYARLQSPAAWGEVECGALLEQVKADLTPRLTATGAMLELGPLPRIRGGASRLYQLFLNLVSNGIKFQRPDTPARVTVSAEERDGECVLCIADDGIGVEAKNQRTIFDAFRRLHARSEYEGTGLGLTICEQIVEQHGGRIWLESELGVGSRFYVALPR